MKDADSKERHPSECQVVVVGGGVIGLNAALALLSRSPRLSVTVLEREIVGGGASRFAGAMDIPYYRNAFQRELVQASWAWHEARGPVEYRRMVPMTWFAESDFDLAHSVTTPLVEGSAEALRPWRVPAAVRLFHGPSYVIDSSACCRALAHELRQSGRAEIVEGAEVTALDDDSHNRLRVLRIDGRAHLADHVVLALGPWFPSWDDSARAMATSTGLRTKRVFGLNVRVANGPGAVLGWPRADIYFHPAPAASSDSEYCLSLRHDEWDVDPDAEHRMLDVVVDRARVFLDQLLGAGGWSLTGYRVFVDTYTPDFQAIVGGGSAFGQDVTIATGTHGSGVRMAPGIAELIARRVLRRISERAVAVG